MIKKRPNVALIIETAAVYGREILRGIGHYQRANGGWSVFLDERELRAPPPEWLWERGCDGVICRSTTPKMAATLRQRAIPTVDLNDRYGFLGLPRVGSDMEAIGRIAAQHLLERGFRHIAFCGFSDEYWSAQRQIGVTKAIGEGQFCGAFNSPWEDARDNFWNNEKNRIFQWLQGLPRPLGIVACNDARAYQILDSCRWFGIAVPTEIAVVGVDNSETFCELCEPSLSSVVPDAQRIGFEAAALLDALMNGEAPPLQEQLIAPREIVVRQSSDILAVDDAAVAAALHFVRSHACSGITVNDILKHAPLSRSTLERSFREILGHSPQEEIRRVKLQRIQQLLSETDWSLTRIAQATAFDSPDYMMVQFKRLTGQTPSQWRTAQRSKSL